jgi:hypothetical protein
MKTYGRIRPREEAIQELQAIGWILRDHQTGGDFEDFIREEPGRIREILLVDFALGRFLYSKDIFNAEIWSHQDERDGDPVFDGLLNALFADEINSTVLGYKTSAQKPENSPHYNGPAKSRSMGKRA